jgi:enamine deaminase RidA (YjgF/YER057c/UK114 family)
MKIASLATAAALLAGSIAGTASAQQIERLSGQPGALILQGVKVPANAEMLYLSGQVASPLDPSKPMSPALTIADVGDTKTQTISVLNKIKALLEAQGYKMSDVIKLTVFLAGDPKLGGRMDFAAMNEAFKQYFGSAANPATVARSTVQVAALAAPAFLVEIEATAARMPAAH